MSKEQIIADGLAAVNAGLQQVIADQLAVACDKTLAEAPIGGGDPSKIFSQLELDQKIADALVLAKQESDLQLASALAADEVIDQELLAQVRAEAAAALAEIQARFDQLTEKEGKESQVLSGLQSSLEQMKSVVAFLSGLVPAVDPAP